MEQQILSQGTVVGERFEVEALAGQGDLGYVYKARDTKIDKPVALRLIPLAALAGEAEIDRIRLRVREASALTHRNVRATFGMGVEENVGLYIAAEWVEGQNLRSLLDKRAKAGKRFSFKGAYNVMGHVCNALTYAHKKTVHGSLSPRAIMVSSAGRVKVADWGLSTVRARLPSYAGRGKLEAVFWAPEVLKDPAQQSTLRADIYSLGALFYELVTGVAPERPLKAPSLLGFTKDVDAVIARCMAADPMQRYESAAAVKAGLAELVTAHEADDAAAKTDDDLGIDVEIDLTSLGAAEPGPVAHKPDQTFGASRGAVKPPAPPKKVSMLDAPGLPPPKNVLPPAAPALPGDGRVSTIDMGEVLKGIGKSEAAHWMVQKDKFDHGPFTDRELIQMILMGEVDGKHQLLNMDDGVRKKVRAWKTFDEYLERYRIKKKEEEERRALQKMERAETRGNMAKVVIGLIVLGVIGLVVGGYFLTRKLRAEKTYTPDEMVAALDSGEIKLKTGGNPVDRKARRAGGGKHRGGGGAGAGGGEFIPGMSYDDAMNMAMNMGSAADNSGQQTLTPEDITAVMDRNVRRFLPCMAGQTIKRVDMNIVIAGDGRVMGVSVDQGDGGLKKCVESKIRSIKFPTSASPRTAASWYFEIY